VPNVLRLLAVAALGAIVAACGDGGDSASTTPAAAVEGCPSADISDTGSVIELAVLSSAERAFLSLPDP
jgi:hypothetical protein